MKRLFLVALLIVLLGGGGVFAQRAVRMGKYSFTPEQNLRGLQSRRLRGAAVELPAEAQANGRYFALVQFEELPTVNERSMLQERGVRLLDYVGGNAFMVSLDDATITTQFRGTQATALAPLQGEWKVEPLLYEKDLPEWVHAGDGMRIKVVLTYFPVGGKYALESLRKLGYTPKHHSEAFRTMDLEVEPGDLQRLAGQAWVASISPAPAPQDLYNRRAAVLNRTNVLSISNLHGGRGLTGKGVNVGVWDGNVEQHPDFGNRLHQQEFEISVAASDSHGVHVAGSVAGGGTLDPAARGMAPGAHLYTYNFNKSSNGLTEHEEMSNARHQFGISISSNSYGLWLDRLCRYRKLLSYNAVSSDMPLDLLAHMEPRLTLVYAAGNDLGACGLRYGTVVRRVKNALYVGALNKEAGRTNFSSWGPQDDGRLGPMISTMGEDVLSTIAKSRYSRYSGTSMATPIVSGTLALLTERYHQLHKGEDPLATLLRGVVMNTADELDELGPDYRYGYGSLNADRAIEVIEKGWHLDGAAIGAGASARIHPIVVPKGVSRLRVMITWNDTVSSKSYVWGESPLINDLDIQVEHAGKLHLPWVLDPNSPSNPAYRGVDRLNNIEQVSVENPAPGVYNVAVIPARVVSMGQPYTLTWYFDREETRITYPNGGERFAAGDTCQVRWYGQGKGSVDISIDGGATYRNLADSVELGVATVVIPADLPNTGNAKIRVRTETGVDVSDATFTLMSRPSDLQVSVSECLDSNWRLTWTKAKGEVTHYKVLKASMSKGTYDTVATLDASQTMFEVPLDMLHGESMQIFSLVSVGPNGIRSERTRGIHVHPQMPVRLTPASPEFDEQFRVYPSPYVIVPDAHDGSQHLDAHYVQQEPGIATPGSHVISIDTHDAPDATIWPSGELPKSMDPAQNLNLMVIRICSIDLTEMRGKKIFLSIDKTHLYKGSPYHSIFMLKINGERFKEQGGQEIIHGVPGSKTVNSHYDLSSYAGSKIKVEMVCGVRNPHADGLSINRIRVFEPVDQSDLYLAKMILPEPSSTLAEELVGVTVVNEGNRKVEGALLRYRVDDGTEKLLAIPELLPFERRDITVPTRIDFSTKESLGQRFEVTMEVLDPHDSNPDNNMLKGEVLNYGSVVRMPESQLIKGFLGTFPRELFQVYNVSKPVIFTDHAGPYGDYGNSQRGTLHFLPTTPGKVIEMTFKSMDTERKEDILGIYTEYEHVELRVAVQGFGNRPEAILSGKLEEPITFVSRNPDGAICAVFRSSGTNRMPGWIAEVREIDAQNLLTLQSVTYDKTFSPDGKVPVTVTVRNNTDKRMTNVLVGFAVRGDRKLRTETIPAIEANSVVDYTFKVLAPAAPHKRSALYAEVAQDDYDRSDNVLIIDVVNDRYCSDRSYETVGNRILEVTDGDAIWEEPEHEIHDDEDEIPERPEDHMYATEVEYMFYKKSRLASIQVRTQPIKGEGMSLFTWVDWNNNAEFEEGERTAVDLKEGQTVAWSQIKIPEHALVGKLRMRVGTAHRLAGNACGKIGLSGSSVDLTANVVDEENPFKFDLAASTIIVASERELSDKEEIVVWVKNMTAYYSKPFEIGLKAGKAAVVWEKCDEEIAPYDSLEYVFKARFDLSEPGRHRIISGIKSDDYDDNNFVAVNAYCVKQVGEPFYALNLYENPKNVKDRREVLLPGDFDGIDLRTTTYEGWFNLRETSLNNLFAGKGALVTTFNRPYSSLAPPNSFLILINDNLLLRTKGDVVRYNEWVHIAVTINSQKSGDPEVALYLNGELQELIAKGSDQMQHVPEDDMRIGYRLEGSVDEIRIWNKVRSVDEIRKYMYQHAYPDFNLKSGLVAEFRLDEGTGNIIARSEKFLMGIYSERIAPEVSDNIWFVPKELLKSVEAVGQTRPVVLDTTGVVDIYFSRSVDLSRVKLKIYPLWPHAKFTYKGKPVTPDTEFDFTSGSVELVPAGVMLFGREMKRSYTLKAVKDLSEECDLLSLSALRKSNPKLVVEESIASSVPQEVLFRLDGITDLSAVRLDFKVSEQATLLYNGDSCVSGKTFFDFNRQVLLTVRSENGLKYKHYSLRTARSQSLELGDQVKTIFYGERVPLAVKASSGLPVTASSSDPSVVVVSDGQLIAVGVGSATITVHQSGNDVYEAAAVETFDVEVEPRTLKVKPVDLVLPYAAKIPAISYEFDIPLPFQVRQDLIAYLNAHAKYQIHEGTAVWSGKKYLPAGTHTWRAGTSEQLVYGPYKLLLQDGALKIEEKKHPMLSLTVQDGSKAPLADALVKINGQELLTGADGKLQIALPHVPDSAYRLEVSKEEFSSHVEVIASTASNLERTATLLPLQIKVQYHALANGKLYGKRSQRIPMNGTTEAVYAIANTNYRFNRWNDGSKENPRVDKNVLAPVTYSAEFVEYKPLMTYKSLGGGMIAGSLEHQVELDGSVTVTAAPDPGYHFVTWSDGNLNPTRTDEGFVTDQVFTALFSRDRELPFVENFDLQAKEPEGWINRDLTGFGKWTIDSKYISVLGTMDSGNFASADSYSSGPSAIVHAELISPWVDVTKSEGNIRVEFDYKYKTIGLGIFQHEGLFVTYTVDGVNWLPIVRIFTEERKAKHADFYIPRAKLGGANKIRFRWLYTHTWDFYAMFDNLRVTAEKVTSYTVNYLATEGGTVECAEALPAHRAAGTPGPKVVAKPALGHSFSHWSDGVKTAERQDTQYTYITAVFLPVVSEFHQVVYTPNEGGHVDGLPVQRVPHGMHATPVKAQPNFGYKFTRWSDGSTVAYRVDKHVVKPLAVTAEFEKLPVHKVTFNTPDSGKLEVALSSGELIASGGTCPAGDTITLHLKPSPGYYTESIKVDGQAVTLEDKPEHRVPVQRDVHIEVTYAPTAFVVTFASSKGGKIEGNLQQHVQKGSPTEQVTATPDKGYIFLTWSDGETNADKVVNAVWANTEYTAYFVERPYVLVHFETSGGTEIADASIRAGMPVTKPVEPVRIGYKFAGWSAVPGDASAQYDFAAPVEASITLYALWTPVEYTVAFDANGGTGKMESVKAKQGVAITLPSNTFTRAGHTFVGWALSATGAALYNDGAMAMNLLRAEGTTATLYAQWVAGTQPIHEVIFVLGADKEHKLRVASGSRVNPMAAPGKQGYELAAWCTDAKLTTAYDFSKPVTGDLKLYPHWAPIIYRVRPTAPFASGAMQEQVFVYGEAQALRANRFERATYTFAGWSLSSNGGVEFEDGALVQDLTTEPGAVVPLYAAWSEVFHAVTFNMRGGEEMQAVQVRSGMRFVEPKAPVRKFHHFEGWYSDEQLKQRHDFNLPVTEDITLHAAWSRHRISYTLSANEPENGSYKVIADGVEVKLPATLPIGTTFVLDITPKSGFRVKSLTVNGEHKKVDEEFVLDKDTHIELTFVSRNTAVEANTFAGVSVYPNPFEGELVIAGAAQVERVELISATGILVRSQVTAGQSEVRLDTHTLQSGLYLLRLHDADGNTKTLRLLK